METLEVALLYKQNYSVIKTFFKITSPEGAKIKLPRAQARGNGISFDTCHREFTIEMITFWHVTYQLIKTCALHITGYYALSGLENPNTL